MPCSVILEPADLNLKNAKGVAFIYKVQLIPPSAARTNIKHSCCPTSYGHYDSYEVFVSKPGEISWRFTLYPTPEEESPSWAGRFDSITAEIKNVNIQVRLSNSRIQRVGPSILTNNIES